MRTVALVLPVAPLSVAAHAELQARATVHADEALHPVSPVSYGANVVLSGMSDEKLADPVESFRRMGLTNLRFHLNTGVEYLWETHAPKPGSKFEGWGIFDPLRDTDPFDRVKALRTVVDAGNSVTSDHYRRTDLRCSGIITGNARSDRATFALGCGAPRLQGWKARAARDLTVASCLAIPRRWRGRSRPGRRAGYSGPGRRCSRRPCRSRRCDGAPRRGTP